MTMPREITHNGTRYVLTRYTGTTLPACEFGAGLKSYEYWADDNDAQRLHAVSPKQYWVD
jgi:hypothetical protein